MVNEVMYSPGHGLPVGSPAEKILSSSQRSMTISAAGMTTALRTASITRSMCNAVNWQEANSVQQRRSLTEGVPRRAKVQS